LELLRTEYRNANEGFVYIPEVLDDTFAEALHRQLLSSPSWGLRLCMGDNIQGLAPSDWQCTSPSERSELAQGCYRRAATGFAFLRQEIWPQSNTEIAMAESDKPLAHLDRLLRSHEFLAFCASVVGVSSLEITESAFVRYGPGDFYAFTVGPPSKAEFGFFLDLTRAWNPEWGGLTEFLDLVGDVERAYIPSFNGLCLYSLRRHSCISHVAAFARAMRYSICGKLRII
jgi:SM-20-related protein